MDSAPGCFGRAPVAGSEPAESRVRYARRSLDSKGSRRLRPRTLLSGRARQRGLFDTTGSKSLLANPHSPHWFNVIWKALSIEVWASIFLDESPRSRLWPEDRMELSSSATEAAESPVSAGFILQECRELGVRRTLARGAWELKTRSGLVRVKPMMDSGPADLVPAPGAFTRLPFADPLAVGGVMRSHHPGRTSPGSGLPCFRGDSRPHSLLRKMDGQFRQSN